MYTNKETESARYEGNSEDHLFAHDTPEMFPTLALRDGLDQPISGIEVHIDLPDGATVTTKTDMQGVATLPPMRKPKGHATVKVRGHDHNIQQVCKVDLDRCQGSVIIRSPKVVVPMTSRLHQHATAIAQSSKGEAWFEQNGTLDKAWVWLKSKVHSSDTSPLGSGNTHPHIVKESLSKAGNPIVIAVGPECPNQENLLLGRNNIYRAAIIAAAKRVGIMPQALAALIDAEAAKKTISNPIIGADGKPVINKKTGKPKVNKIQGEWDSGSYNAQSRAAGLTQFLESTWLAHVMLSGRYIHEQSMVKGWVKQEAVTKGKSHIVFVLADGKSTTAPYAHRQDANVQACLKQRFTPEWAIMAAADYGKANLDVLKKSGFKLNGLNDAEKAKLMYLLHHEGEGAGPLFIRNELHKLPKGKFASAEERLKHVFVQQVGLIETEKWINSTGGVFPAYRLWLSKYINDKFDDLGRFACDRNVIQHPLAVSDIFEKIN